MIIKSRYVAVVDGPVIENGGVEICDGLIADVGPANRLTGEPEIDFGDAVILPGLINAHTHLELSSLAGLVPVRGRLVDWLKRLMEIAPKGDEAEENIQEAVERGIERSIASGVTAMGDVTRFPDRVRAILGDSGLHAVSFGEVIAIGQRRALLTERLEAAACRDRGTPLVRPGISPHSPYTVEPEALIACAKRAAQTNAPLCIHLCETPDEEAFTRMGGGVLADYLRDIDAWDDDIPIAGVGPVELARSTGVLTDRTIVAHGNYVSDRDIGMIASARAGVAYCVRTHAAFGHSPHRFRDMLRAGVNVCIGTDSLASNPDLSVLAELRFLHRLYPDFPCDDLLEMGTLRGARALGMAERIGSISGGKVADLVVVRLDEHASASRWDSILESKAEPVAVYVSGRRRV